MGIHEILTLIFLIIPAFLMLLKKYFLVKKGFFIKGTKKAFIYERICLFMILIYNAYFLFYFYPTIKGVY